MISLTCTLFVPGDSARKLERAATSGADALILDLEDAVAPAAKAEARALVAERLWNRTPMPCLVRVNGLDTGLTEDDVAATAPLRPAGYVLPKCTGPGDLDQLSALIDRHGGDPSIGIFAIATESVRAVRSLMRSDWSHPRLMALAWGGEDLAADLGALRNRDAAGAYLPVFVLARETMLLAAREAGVAPIDSVFVDTTDPDGLAAEARAAAETGFVGKMAIHPAQVPIIQQAFRPSPDDIAWAEAALQALDADGSGVAVLNGQMLDRPHRTKALAILARAGREVCADPTAVAP